MQFSWLIFPLLLFTALTAFALFWKFRQGSNNKAAEEPLQNRQGPLSINSPEAEQNPPIDEKAIHELFGLIRSPEKRLLLLHAFENSSTEHLTRLKLAAHDQNISDYLLHIHSFKGCAATLGVQSVVSLCDEIEAIGNSITHDEMHHYTNRLELAFNQSKILLNDYLQQPDKQ